MFSHLLERMMPEVVSSENARIVCGLRPLSLFFLQNLALRPLQLHV